jgi:hypothetical protein
LYRLKAKAAKRIIEGGGDGDSGSGTISEESYYTNFRTFDFSPSFFFFHPRRGKKIRLPGKKIFQAVMAY